MCHAMIRLHIATEWQTKANKRTRLLACLLAWEGDRKRIFIIYWHFSYLPLHFSVPCVYHLLICGPVIFFFHSAALIWRLCLSVCVHTHFYYFVSVTLFFEINFLDDAYIFECSTLYIHCICPPMHGIYIHTYMILARSFGLLRPFADLITFLVIIGTTRSELDKFLFTTLLLSVSVWVACMYIWWHLTR